MSFRLARPGLRLFALASMAALSATVAGCSGASNDDSGANTDDITQVTQSAVKRQSIGNCWIYATASWSESLTKNATGKESNFSESYWTYWHWFEQIANGSLGGDSVSTGGGFGTAAELINRYGVMNEGDFIPSEANAEMSGHQESAESAINVSLKSGALKSATARKNRELVRQELDKAWGLAAAVSAQLDKAFGTSVSKTLDKSASTTGTKIMTAKSLSIKVWNEKTQQDVTATLQDAIGTGTAFHRTGTLAWNETYYPTGDQERRDFQKRFQRGLHHGVPVIMSWYVDFNAMEAGGQFRAPPAQPGRQGGHMVVMDDYQISNVPGFGTLPAGTLETRQAALDAALDDKATLDFIRIKNSWGSVRVDRDFTSGYHDLWSKYLNGPIQQCETDEETDMPKPGTCHDATPFESIVLPPGL
jgi:hypothetical protein